jgi:gluconate kinase
MIIFFAGLIGTGKTSLAKAMARDLGFFYYDVDAVKKEIYPTDSNFEYNIKNNIPFSDDTRMKVFERVILDLKSIYVLHKNIIVDETLHKKSLRNFLFEGVKEYCDQILLVWVKAGENVIKERLHRDKREGHILKDSFGMYLSLKKEFDQLDEADIIFENKFEFDESLNKLRKLLLEKVK